MCMLLHTSCHLQVVVWSASTNWQRGIESQALEWRVLAIAEGPLLLRHYTKQQHASRILLSRIGQVRIAPGLVLR